MIRMVLHKCLPLSAVQGLRKIYYPHVLNSFKEEKWPCAQWVRRLLQPGDTVLDVGANIGYVTVLLSRWVGGEGCVLSFEPVPSTFELLQHGVRKLRLGNVDLHHCALSADQCSATMEIPRYASGGQNLYESKIVADDTRSDGLEAVTVRCRTMDSFLPDVSPRMSFVKIDVEGHELAVIKGAEAFIKKFTPAFLIEVSADPDKAGSPAQELFAIMGGHGYRPFYVESGKLKSRAPGVKAVDYFFLNEQQADRLSVAF